MVEGDIVERNMAKDSCQSNHLLDQKTLIPKSVKFVLTMIFNSIVGPNY